MASPHAAHRAPTLNARRHMTTPPTPNPATPTTPERSERRLLAASAGLITAIVLTDILTPASLVIGTLVSAPLALAALGATRRATVNLTALAVTGNVLAGLVNATRDGATPTDLGNRAVSILAALLVGFLSLRAREAATRAARLHEEERRLQRERALRALIEAVSGPLTQAQFVTRAAHALQALTGAAAVEIGSVDRAVLREPHAYTGPGEGSLGRRLPLDLLARPATRDPGQGRPDQVWAVGGGDTYVARLTRPSDPELLILLTRPAAPPTSSRKPCRPSSHSSTAPPCSTTCMPGRPSSRNAGSYSRTSSTPSVTTCAPRSWRTP
ncbi:hypothetical protein [Deinococcus actinosclerus]|uniref:GAF domain-containing protein n=1 Tax=Deinococcus actinosclerus TaxID=1768108 RepID=A0ABM5X6J9_9DEIO|nr:hypothetical protein [Deinococcus actinosclerus]ALW89386.1 hypothetical protein AUC44_11165 [Deinococcus actinosclerus]